MKMVLFILLIFSAVFCADAQSTISNQILQNAFQDIAAGSGKLYNGTGIPQYSIKDSTRGSRYLFKGWVKGAITSANNVIISNDSFWLNFDKITQQLFVSLDKKNVIGVENKEFKALYFRDSSREISLERVPWIDNKKLLIVLVSDKGKYALYKLLNTKLKRADHVDDGVQERGNNYDEFVDAPIYYVLFPNHEYRNLYVLKSKAIEKLFSLGPEAQPVKTYLNAHVNAPENESLITNLILFLNQ